MHSTPRRCRRARHPRAPPRRCRSVPATSPAPYPEPDPAYRVRVPGPSPKPAIRSLRMLCDQLLRRLEQFSAFVAGLVALGGPGRIERLDRLLPGGEIGTVDHVD